MGRRDRRGCAFDAIVPDLLATWDPAIPADVAAGIPDAETAVRSLNDAGIHHVSLEGMARFLLRAESVVSSKIEGLDAGPRRLAAAEVAPAQGGDAADRVAVEVLGNIAAMESAVARADETDPFRLDDLLAVHAALMTRSPTPVLGGQIRDRQNWIGGSSYNPCSAAFVPRPPGEVAHLLADPHRIREQRPPLAARAGRLGACPVRDDPSVRGGEWPDRNGPDAGGPSSPAARTPVCAADQPGARDLVEFLHRGTDGLPPRRRRNGASGDFGTAADVVDHFAELVDLGEGEQTFGPLGAEVLLAACGGAAKASAARPSTCM